MRAILKRLVFKQEVVEAAKVGKFSLYAVKTIEEGITILTGVEVGEIDKRGNYSKDSVNGRIMTRLQNFTKMVQKYSNSAKK